MSQKDRSRFILSVLAMVVAIMCILKVFTYEVGLPFVMGLLGFNFFSQAFYAKQEGNRKEMIAQLLMGAIIVVAASFILW